MPAWRLLGLAALLATAAPVALPAEGTLPEWGRALTPAQGREMRAEIARLSAQSGVQESTLIAIARILGANLRDISFPELIERVRSQAGRAAELHAQVGELQTQIASLADAALRDPAEQALARAAAAFDEGRLDDADRELASLESLRLTESESARAAWFYAVDARARVAELRLDYNAAESLRLSAAREEQRTTRLSLERQWRLIMAAATARYNQGEIRGDNAALERAIVLYRNEALPLVPRSEWPDEWAVTQNDLGNALLALGERETGATRLEEAVRAYEAALQVSSRQRTPRVWARTLNNLGHALFRLGGRQSGAAGLRRSAAAYETALEELPRELYPLDWATTQVHLANAVSALGAQEAGTARLERAAQIYQTALQELDRDQAPFGWAMAQNNLATTLRALGNRNNDIARLQQAAATYEVLLEEWTRDRYPLQWAMVQNNLGRTLHSLGWEETGTGLLERAAAAFEAALQEWTRDRHPVNWAQATANLVDALVLICERTRDLARLDEAERRLREVQGVLRSGDDRSGLGWVRQVLRRVAAARRRIGP